MVSSDKDLKEKIEAYVKDKGWPGFFGLLATISPDKVDKDDLDKLEGELSVPYNDAPGPSVVQFENNNETIQGASIYAKEHIPAVQEDAREQGIALIDETKETPKTKVLEPPKNSVPNPWGNTETVAPGQLEL